ncbi:MAG: histidinol-phosphate aminotransferase family protein [Gemmatimonadota bacterium]|nr:histidinol-phosphate aminotransferase family protein [Gemmatimonadota bacterium]
MTPKPNAPSTIGDGPAPRACYNGIRAYAPDARGCRIDLSDNTNQWGPPPAALRALRSSTPGNIARYPEPYSATLRECLAQYAGVVPEMIVAGCGSDDIIDSAMRAFGEPGETLCLADPTFTMVPVFAAVNGLSVATVPFDAQFEISADAVLATGAQVIYLCSPNNPTGTTLPFSLMKRIVEHAKGLVIVDEAYIEFGGESALPLVASGKVLVTRTLSKAFGLAGLRAGYGIGSAAVIAAIEKARGPYKVNAIAEVVAAAAVTEDLGWLSERVADTHNNRARFFRELTALGFAPIPSAANFVLVPVSNCSEAADRLRDGGIAARAFQSLAGIGDALRITIGPWEMMQPCLDALKGSR